MLDILIIFSAKYLYLFSVTLFITYWFITHRKKDFLFFALFVLSISFLTSILASHLYYNPRPFVVSNVTALIAHAPNNGFPSDHALLTGTLASIVSVFSVPFGAVLWVLAILVGVARVMAHVHHTLDIMGSYAIAITSAVIMYPFYRRLQKPFVRFLERFGIQFN